MTVRQALPAILRGDEPADLGPEARERLEALASQAAEEGMLAFLRDECAGRLRQPGASPAVEYLLAAACAHHGEIERAHQTLLALGERLVAAKTWEPLAAVAERALVLEHSQAAARLLVTAHEGLGVEPARTEALERAWVTLQDDLELGLRLAILLGEAGRLEDRRALLAELVPRFAAARRWAGLEESALEFVEHEDLEGLIRLVEALPEVAADGALAEARQLFEIAFPALAARGRAGTMHATLRALASRAIEKGGASAGEPFRPAMVEALRQGPARELPDPTAVIAAAGIEDPQRPLLGALERFDTIAALPPGRGVVHGSFGPGRVLANDGHTVAIDFARSRGHRMPYAAALRSLTPLAEDDLRLLQFTNPAELERLRREDPGEVLVRALGSIGGEADAQKLKVFLVGFKLVPAAEWTVFFRKLRATAEKDPRIDHARAFEQHYRLAPKGAASDAADAETPLPGLEPRKPIRTNLATLRKFLSQHPQAETAVARRFGRLIERALLDPEGDRADRARCGMYFARWFPERIPEWIDVLRALWDQGLSISDLSGEEEQIALLDVSHAAGVESDAILSAMDSRFAAVRQAAARYHDQLDDRGRRALRRTLVAHAPRYPAAALRLLEREVAGEAPPHDAWPLLAAALALLEDRPRPAVADKVLRWIVEDGPFHRWLRNTPCPDDLRLRLTVLLRQWRSSDRYLFPALELAERLGLGEAVAAVRAARQRSTDKLFSQVGQQAEVELPVMTRATWERLRQELERLERELRTTIPRTIQKARELGDLRENAEYHSAKLKQANVSKQVASLQSRLTRARFVDDAELQDGIIGLGTEVVLESEKDIVTYWILGEGEQHHGDNVISFQSQVGRALTGKQIGDEIEIPEAGERRRYRVVSIERRLPPHATAAERT